MYEWENIDFKEAVNLVTSRDPREFSVGYYSIDGSVMWPRGAFSWFESQEELLDYLVNIESQVISIGNVKKTIQGILATADLNKGLSDNLRTQINKVVIGQISWWGEFSNLCSGKDSFSRHLVDHFFGHIDREYSGNKVSRKVTAKYVPRFVVYCQEDAEFFSPII